MRSAMGPTAFQSSVYCAMDIWCSVLNIGPVTFQRKLCVVSYSVYVSASRRESPCAMPARSSSPMPMPADAD